MLQIVRWYERYKSIKIISYIGDWHIVVTEIRLYIRMTNLVNTLSLNLANVKHSPQAKLIPSWVVMVIICNSLYVPPTNDKSGG